MLLNGCEFPPQRRSLPSLLTGFGVPVAVRVPYCLTARRGPDLFNYTCSSATFFSARKVQFCLLRDLAFHLQNYRIQQELHETHKICL